MQFLGLVNSRVDDVVFFAVGPDGSAASSFQAAGAAY